MNAAPLSERLESLIQEAYDARRRRYRGSALGWRLLYGPRRALSGTQVAFVGLNPGGQSVDPAHRTRSTEAGSAYCKAVEDWGPSSTLQDQVIALFRRLDVAPEDVLAGNLVPFRSASEDTLTGASEAIAFGRTLWKEILAEVRPRLVVSIGRTANREVSGLLLVRDAQTYPTGWRAHTASRGRFPGGTWIGLPHLSRFGIMTRRKSEAAMDALFKEID